MRKQQRLSFFLFIPVLFAFPRDVKRWKWRKVENWNGRVGKIDASRSVIIDHDSTVILDDGDILLLFGDLATLGGLVVVEFCLVSRTLGCCASGKVVAIGWCGVGGCRCDGRSLLGDGLKIGDESEGF